MLSELSFFQDENCTGDSTTYTTYTSQYWGRSIPFASVYVLHMSENVYVAGIRSTHAIHLMSFIYESVECVCCIVLKRQYSM
jgi:hypothetical protein